MARPTRTDLLRMKRDGRKIAVATAYDFTGAKLADRAGVDVILVGDSLGMVVQGHDSTLPVTLDHMVYHTACVTRAQPRCLVVADLPFGTFQVGRRKTLEASIRLVQESGAQAVKIEGAYHRLRIMEAVAKADIPVWGHLGLTPQSIHALGGYKVQGKDPRSAQRLVDHARQVETAGASALVLECVPPDVAREITESVSIPTIGIGAGPHTDGQVLVFHDLLGLYDGVQPRFVKRYAEGAADLSAALARYVDEVRRGAFPAAEHSYDELGTAAKGRGEA